MTEPLFLADLDAPEVGQLVALTGDEGRHAAAVRRLRVGEIILISDGNGTAVRGPVATADKTGLSITVEEVLHSPASPVKYVAVEMLTELGIDEIVPWQSERSVVRWAPDRTERGLTRWRATAREAAKQCRRFRVPTVAMPMTTAELALRIAQTDLTVVLHEGAEEYLGSFDVPTSGEVMFIIGPEGGLTEEEVDTFTAAGGRAALISENVLRTSTAGIVALAQLQALRVRGN